MYSLGKRFALLAWIALIPTAAHAQGSIAGVVKDASGAVLPGVTVEASSPALIEKTRSVVTDGTGQYRIVDLRPGPYTVTFTLAGFNTVKREGVELAGSFTATIDADMRVGAIEETITVTGETPIVDVQSTTRQRVLDHDVIDVIPTARQHSALAVLIPGLTVNGLTNQDVGGARSAETFDMVVHGSRPDDQRLTVNGLSFTGVVSGSNIGAVPNMGAMQEVAVDYASVSAELATGGVRINFIPREGGNIFSGSLFAGYANSSMQGSNYDQDLKDRGLSSPDSIKRNWDVNPGFGGPIKRDTLWFYTSVRHFGADNRVAGMFENLNANNPAAWTFEPDPGRPALNKNTFKDGQGRLTWQVTAKNKFAIGYDQQNRCSCPNAVTATTAPEAGFFRRFPMQRSVQADWTSPITSRLLFEAVTMQRVERAANLPVGGLNPQMISVTEQSTGLTYRANPQYRYNWNDVIFYRAAVSYITGAHAFKVGLNNGAGTNGPQRQFDNQPVSYRFNNGVPNQITLRARPYSIYVNIDNDLGLFAQDKWTIDRLTLTLGVRYDHLASGFPEQNLGPTVLFPTRNITFPESSNLRWHDVTPKSGISYDLFGNGKTALKVSLNKYLQGQATGGLASGPNPINTIVVQTTRSWNDANRNFIPECELTNPLANGECAAMADANFGKIVSGSTFDPDVMRGWGRRPFNWELSAGVQHEVLPRVSADVSYFRRWYGNFSITDNRTVAPADFDPFSITAPADPRLPNGGGYVISGLYDLKPAKFGLPADNFVTSSSRFGKQIEHWNGVDVGVSARPPSGLLVQGGLSTGRTTTDSCAILAKLDNPSQLYCKVQTPFLTQLKALAAYTLPRVDVQISGTFQSIPGPEILANFNAPNASVAPSLGRSLSGNAANVTVNLVSPGTMYGERLNQLDLRFGKLLRVGRSRTTVSVDIYNALNSNTVLALNNNFAAWQRPTSILTARFAKISMQLDF